MSLDLVHIVEQLGIDSTKFHAWKDAVFGTSEEQALPPKPEDGSHDSVNNY